VMFETYFSNWFPRSSRMRERKWLPQGDNKLCPILCPLWNNIGIIQYRMARWLIVQKCPSPKGLMHIK
jgi:hypothetical protein